MYFPALVKSTLLKKFLLEKCQRTEKKPACLPTFMRFGSVRVKEFSVRAVVNASPTLASCFS